MIEVLIVRSAPIQQLDASLPKIRAKFNNSSISILSHEHSIDLLQKYRDVKEVIPYPFRKSFAYKRKVSFDSHLRFDHVVVMVGNLSGAGFLNVLFFALGLPAGKIWVCNLVGQLRLVSRHLIILTAIRNQLYKSVSVLLSTCFCLFFFPFLTIFLIRKSSKGV
jgi:hypothetical protein